MANAKLRPKKRRFRSSHFVIRVGHSVAREEAVNASRNNGSAQRTDSNMAGVVPAAERKSVRVSDSTLTTLMMSATSQNSCQDSTDFLMPGFRSAPTHNRLMLNLLRAQIANVLHFA